MTMTPLSIALISSVTSVAATMTVLATFVELQPTTPVLARVRVNDTRSLQGVRSTTASGVSVYGQAQSVNGTAVTVSNDLSGAKVDLCGPNSSLTFRPVRLAS